MADNWVTQDEALAITRLLSALERAPKDGMKLEELADLLQVSVEEARVLTSLVRHQASGRPAVRTRGARFRHWLIGVVTVCAAVQSYSLMARRTQAYSGSSDALWAAGMALWTLGVLWYYRMPILRLIHRFFQGYQSQSAPNGSRVAR